jgi:hypothetical protein
VADDPAEAWMILDEQPEPVGRQRGRRVPGKGGRLVPPGQHLRELHFPSAGAPHRMRAVGLGLAWRERGGEAGHPAGEVPDTAEDPAHRGERPGRVERHRRPAVGRAPVAVCGACGPGTLLTGRLELLGLEPGARHAERAEQAMADVGRVRRARDGGDDPAQDRVAEVGVLEPGTRRPVDGHAAGQETVEVFQRQALLAIPPRVVGGEARGHGEQVPDRHAGRVRRHGRPAAQLGDVFLGQVVELQQAVVAQLEDRGGGETLGHRGDPEDRLGVRRRPAEVPLAETGRVHQLAVQHDPVGQPGLPAPLLMTRRQSVHVREIGHRPSLSEPPRCITALGRRAIIDRVRVRREGDTRHGGW